MRDEAALQSTLSLIIGRLEDFAKRVHDHMSEIDWLMQRDVIRTLVKRVEINQDDINVVFRVDGTLPTPDPTSPGQNSFGQNCGRGEDRALGSAFAGWKQKAFFQHAGCQEPSDQSPHLQVSDTGADALHQPMVIDMVKRGPQLMPLSRTRLLGM